MPLETFFKRAFSWSLVLLTIIAAISMLWSIQRSFLGVMINSNEGWNAFFGDAAMGKMQLYPSPDELITNNYPPLSFYIVGSLGKILGDTILAGRLLSLLAIGVISIFIAQIIKKLSITSGKLASSLQGRLIGVTYFIGTLTIFFKWYVGANDPQLLAQAIMIIGFSLFIKAMEQERNYWIAIFVMVIAGFFKHNIITMPLTIMLWLLLQKKWKVFFFCSFFALSLIILGFAICLGAYGFDFYYNFTSPRSCLLFKVSHAFSDLGALSVGLLFWFFTSWKFRKESSVHLVSLMVFIALIVGFVQRLGNGVFVNAQFDLVIALSIGLGIAFTLCSRDHCYLLQLIGIIALALFFLLEPSFLYIFSPSYHRRLAESEQIMKDHIEMVRAMPGDVFCESYVAYRAGKPFAADALNVEERMRVGRLPKDTMTRRFMQHQLREVDYVWDVGIE
ncbi:MAG: glycosyltransferase family 39 protein [Chthoniobacterales bacterium]|nr:glycosyltransferase family 39 protein [Chthoniobacterales bacterium]